MNKKEQRKAEAKAEAIKALKRDCKVKPTSRLAIVITKVSSSGMSRRMTVYNISGSQLFNMTYWVADLCDLSINMAGELLVGGCGMDMTFWLADRITKDLFGSKKLKGFNGNGGSCLDWQSI